MTKSRLRSAAAMLIAATTLLTSCVKHTTTSTYDEGTMTVTVNGTTFTSRNVHACSCGAPDSYQVNVSGSSINMVIRIKDPKFVAGATATLDTAFTEATATYSGTSGTTDMRSKNGSVTITELSAGNEVKGTFSFNCTNGTAITNGSFTAHF